MMDIPVRHLQADLVVVGGGLSGLMTAVAAARNGAKAILVQDRPMLGGNASSEIRMWICGAHGANNKESGLLEELMCDNYFYNPELKYTVWDDVMFNLAHREPNLKLLLNTTVQSVRTEAGRILSVRGWNLTEYCFYELSGKLFADCSGDGILRLSGAEYRQGRESSAEFNESHAPAEADAKTMGNSILIQVRRTDVHRPFRAPEWAYHYTDETAPKRRLYADDNFWWMEFGGVRDTIRDAEEIRLELMKIAYGVWEYIKNHPDGRGRQWELDWIGKLPGKRESVRYVGDHTICQSEVEAGGRYPDVIGHGGWSMDDHHPEAIYYPGPPTIYHPAPSPYGIPYRALYSRNIENLFFAGRDLSATHMALSSTRVMATCAVMGQAVGTAAALAIRYGTTPRGVYREHLAELQDTLQDQDQFIPYRQRRVSDLTRRGHSTHPELADGDDRNQAATIPLNTACAIEFDHPETIKSCRIIFDSDLSDYKKMRCVEGVQACRRFAPYFTRNFRLEAKLDGVWQPLATIRDNHHRLVTPEFAPVAVTAVRLIPERTWGGDSARLFSFEVR